MTRHRLALLILACVLASLAYTTTASADYRYDNHWAASPKLVQQTIRNDGYQIKGDATGYRWQRVLYVKCKGDASPEYDVNRARGLYHHLYCAASLRGNARFFATFDAWWVGSQNYRVSNIDFQAYS